MATKAIVGEKVGMTQIWDDQHRAIPVTVVRVAPVRVVQVKTPEREGYSALQVTYGYRRTSTLTKPEQGHFDKAGVDPGRRLVELRLDDTSEYEVGQELTADLLQAGELVDVTAVSKGKGFAGGHEAPQLQRPGRLATVTTSSTGRPVRSGPAPRRPGCSRAPGWPVGWVASR